MDDSHVAENQSFWNFLGQKSQKMVQYLTECKFETTFSTSIANLYFKNSDEKTKMPKVRVETVFFI